MNTNPYPKGTRQYQEWELEQKGFNQAQIKLILECQQSSQFDLSVKQAARSDEKSLTM